MTCSDRGFTLVEMLIALSIVGLTVAIIGGALRTGLQYLNRSSRAQTELEQANLLRTVLRDALRQVLVPSRAASIQGDDKHLTIHSAPLRLPAYTGETVLSLDGSADAGGLLATWQGSDRLSESISSRILTTDRNVVFSYFKKDMGWVTLWPGGAGLPDIIRSKIEDKSAGRSITMMFPVGTVHAYPCKSSRGATC